MTTNVQPTAGPPAPRARSAGPPTGSTDALWRLILADFERAAVRT